MLAESRPRIPKEWYQPSGWRTLAFVTFALAMVFGPVWATAWLVDSSLSLWIKLPGLFILMIAAAHGIHLTGWVGHEGLHCNLHRNKYVSFVLGIVVAAVGSSSVVGHALNHWNHHRYVNTESDPDAQMYAQYKTRGGRLWGPRATSHSAFHRYTVLCALERELPVGFRLPFQPRTARRLAWFGLAMLAASAVGWVSFLILHPWHGLLGYVIPALLIAGPMSSWRVFAEHADTDTGLWTNSRSYVHWIYTVLFFGNNYHLEHHLYPGVPCYHLPKVHRLLRDAGHFARQGSFIDRELVVPLGLTHARHFYPQAAGMDIQHDPFLADVSDYPVHRDRLQTPPASSPDQVRARSRHA